ncbi:MAG: N-acetylneuraminate synthase family protein [Saprospiraceae bacterium]|nr:N-acetylneuraminate synthase family protein [Saprospiraceae bacterium]
MSIKTIADTAWHHDGDIDFMEKLVEEIICQSETDIIKLHITLNIDEYMLPDHSGYQFLKGRMFNKEQWTKIIEEINCSEKALMLLCNDTEAIEFGMQFEPSLVELHSVCLDDIHLLSALRENNSHKTPVVLGVGGSTLYEIEHAISCLENDNIVLMHGFQNYPTQYEDINFNRIKKIINLYPNYKHGYADHTAWNEPNNNMITVMGAALGMEYTEKHVTIVPGEERTDWQAAISIEQFNSQTKALKILDKCNGDGLLRLNEGERKYSIFGPMKKAAVFNRDLRKGEVLLKGNISFKRTSQLSSTPQSEIFELVGKRVKADCEEGKLITKDKVE